MLLYTYIACLIRFKMMLRMEFFAQNLRMSEDSQISVAYLSKRVLPNPTSRSDIVATLRCLHFLKVNTAVFC
jgi:hypothetical protein